MNVHHFNYRLIAVNLRIMAHGDHPVRMNSAGAICDILDQTGPGQQRPLPFLFLSVITPQDFSLFWCLGAAHTQPLYHDSQPFLQHSTCFPTIHLSAGKCLLNCAQNVHFFQTQWHFSDLWTQQEKECMDFRQTPQINDFSGPMAQYPPKYIGQVAFSIFGSTSWKQASWTKLVLPH